MGIPRVSRSARFTRFSRVGRLSSSLEYPGFLDFYGQPDALEIDEAYLLESATRHKKVRFIWLIHRKVVILQADYYRPLE